VSLSAFAIRRPITTAMFFIAVGLLGVVSLNQLQVELLPEVVYPEIYVALAQPAYSPEQVERDLIMPAEGEVSELSGVVEMESTAMMGQGTLRISFAPSTDMKFALLQVQGRMDRLQPSLPELTQIMVQRFDTSMLSSSVMDIQVLGEGDINWLREFSEQKIRPELEAVEGVVSATVLGGQRSAIEVILDLDQMEAHRISPGRVRTSINSVNQPRAYVGRAYDGNHAYPVSLHGQFTSLREIREVMIDATVPLRLGDMAIVRRGLQERTDLSRVNGMSAVSIRILKEDEANLIDVADDLVNTVGRLNVDLAPENIELLVNQNQAELMQGALETLVQAAIVGLILGLVVLFLFLRNVRFVAVLLLAIPASLLLTFNLMYAWDLSLNVLSMCGLALAMGMLADNGIVVMESVFKHFERGKSPRRAARDGTAEVTRAVVASTATTVTVFLPVVFIQSDFQDILRDLALSITFPLLASLLVALTLIPMLGARTLSQKSLRPLGTGRLMGMYTVLLKAGLRHRVRVSVIVGVVLLVSLIAAFFLMLQQEVMQEESQFTVYASLADGATLEVTDEVIRKVEDAIRELDGVERFITSVQERQGSVSVQLVALADRPKGVSVDQLKDQLEEDTSEIPDAVIGYDPPTGLGGGGGGARIGGSSGSGGFSLDFGAQSEMAVVRGHDFATLQMIAEDLVYRLEEVEDIDVNSVQSDVQRSAPEVQVIPDAVAMFDRAIDIGDLLGAIEGSSVEGFRTSIAFLEADGTETPIEVRPVEDPETQQIGVDDLRRLPILTPSGDFTPMEEVSRVRTDEGRRSILRTDRTRRVVVSYNFLDEVLDSQPRLDAARRMVRVMAQNLYLPEGYSIEIIEGEVDTVYYWMMGIAAILVYMILASLFESFASPIVIFCTLPTAAIGSVWALILSGTGLTSQAGPMALLGLVVLIGIAVNNGIILIDAISTLRSRHGYRRERAVLVAGRSRVRPILMTSATTLLGVLPLAMKFGGDYEIWPPFAITILGGLSVSMVSTLIFIPVAYMGIDQVKEWLRSMGWIGVSIATLATAATSYAFHLRYESIYWTALVVVPFWFAFLTMVWIVQRLRRLRVAARKAVEPIRTIRLNTLTKIYGAPGRLRRDWGRFERRTAILLDAGEDPVDRAAIKEGLSWKLPLLVLMILMLFYLEDRVWVYLLALATWTLVSHLAGSIVVLLPRELTRPRRGFRIAAGLAFAFTFFDYIQWRIGLLSVTLASICLWLVILFVRWLAKRVRTGEVNIDRMTGRLPRVRGNVYKAASKVPFIGVRRPPFQALIGVNLEIGKGMFGLLGPNGAGKTTLMRVVTRVLEPTYGSVSLNGINVKEWESLQGIVGYLPQSFGLYDHMSAYEFLDYRALLEGLRGQVERRDRILWCLQQVHLEDRKDDLIGSYSGGMRQRVGIAQTLLHTPRVIVVDEPTAGLDPVERIRFRNLLARLSQDRIIIFSTHIVEDVAGSCNRLAVLNKGRVLYSGTPRSMRELARDRVWEAVLSEDDFHEAEPDLRLISHLRTPAGIRARFLARQPMQGLAAEPVEPTLEDAYLQLLQESRGLA